MLIHYKPWVGQRYHDGVQGLKLLVLGESHYDFEHSTSMSDTKTIDCVQEHIANIRGKPYSTYTKLLSCIHGERQDPDMREESWSYLAFNNFLLAPMEAPRQNVESLHGPIDGNSEILQASHAHFLETCRQLAPDLVIALGKNNVYCRIASLSAIDSPREQDRNEDDPIRITDGTNRWCLMWVKHPSHAFSWGHWHQKFCSTVKFIERQRVGQLHPSATFP